MFCQEMSLTLILVDFLVVRFSGSTRGRGNKIKTRQGYARNFKFDM